jgi:hypothetical protein
MLNFVVAVYLETAIILSEFGLTLDALLAGIAWRQHYDFERAIRELPIAHLHGVPQASIALLGHSEQRRTSFRTIGSSFVRELEQAGDILDSLDRMPPKSLRKPTNGPFKNVQSTYVLTHVPVVYFAARGDLEEVQRALRQTHFIGGQTTKGYGQVTRTEVWAIDNAEPHFGLVANVCGRQTILRPVPMALRQKFPNELDYVTASVTWKNPYNPTWPSARVERCMVPPAVGAFGAEDF